jgi:hypothetical protein
VHGHAEVDKDSRQHTLQSFQWPVSKRCSHGQNSLLPVEAARQQNAATSARVVITDSTDGEIKPDETEPGPSLCRTPTTTTPLQAPPVRHRHGHRRAAGPPSTTVTIVQVHPSADERPRRAVITARTAASPTTLPAAAIRSLSSLHSSASRYADTGSHYSMLFFPRTQNIHPSARILTPHKTCCRASSSSPRMTNMSGHTAPPLAHQAVCWHHHRRARRTRARARNARSRREILRRLPWPKHPARGTMETTRTDRVKGRRSGRTTTST